MPIAPTSNKYADDWRELEAHLRTRTPEWAARITGLPVAEIEDFARLYGSSRRSYLRLGFGFTRTRNAAANMHAASCLPVVSGVWQYEGGGALYNQGDLYHWTRPTSKGSNCSTRRSACSISHASGRSWSATAGTSAPARPSRRC